MELLEGLKTRRSVRRYTDELISHELFEEIIDTAKMAPTWKNTQTLRYILIQNEEIIKKICDDCLLGFEHNAKTLSKCKNLVVLTQVNGRCGYEKDGSFSTSKGTGWEMFDAGIAAMTFSPLLMIRVLEVASWAYLTMRRLQRQSDWKRVRRLQP